MKWPSGWQVTVICAAAMAVGVLAGASIGLFRELAFEAAMRDLSQEGAA